MAAVRLSLGKNSAAGWHAIIDIIMSLNYIKDHFTECFWAASCIANITLLPVYISN